MLICIQESFKLATFIVILTSFISCHSSHKIPSSQALESHTQDTSWVNDQRELGEWLMTQPREVRDSFKRDFTFSKQDIDSIIDTLKNH